MSKCKSCRNYDFEIEECSNCKFEFDDDLYWGGDDWDILELDDDLEWGHLQIMYRLKTKGIDCLYADIWFDKNMAYIVGANTSEKSVAHALGVHEEVVYDAIEIPLIIINLYMEKQLRVKKELSE